MSLVLVLRLALSIRIVGIIDVESAHEYETLQHIGGAHTHLEHRQCLVIMLLKEGFCPLHVKRGTQCIETSELVDVRLVYTFGKEFLDHRSVDTQSIDQFVDLLILLACSLARDVIT